MRRLFILLLSFTALTITAQNLKNKYSSRIADDGGIYFIHPVKGFKGTNIKSDLVFDMTYFTTSDSVTFNFTYYDDIASPVDSIEFIDDTNTKLFSADMIFLEPHKKNKWAHRVTSRIPYIFIEDQFRKDKPFILRILLGENAYIFEMKEKEWKKQAPVINKILQVISLNK